MKKWRKCNPLSTIIFYQKSHSKRGRGCVKSPLKDLVHIDLLHINMLAKWQKILSLVDKILCPNMDRNKSIYRHICIETYKRVTHVKASIYFCFWKKYRLRMYFSSTFQAINHKSSYNHPSPCAGPPIKQIEFLFFSNINKEIIQEIALKNAFTLI